MASSLPDRQFPAECDGDSQEGKELKDVEGEGK